MPYFLLIQTILILLYVLLLIRYTVAWNKKPVSNGGKLNDVPDINVVIPFRNEFAWLNRLMDGLKNQTYPKEKTKIFLINDHSDDGSYQELQRLIGIDKRFVLLSLSEDEYGKKMALQKALLEAKGEIVVFSDADCFHCANWLLRIVVRFQTERCDMLLGPVVYKSTDSIMGKFAEFELAGLIGTAAASAFIGKPVLSNGANISVRRNVLSYKNDLFNGKYASGDDMFLLSKLAKDPRLKICFIKDDEAIVETDPPITLKKFVRQRLRWVSKNKAVSNNKMLYDAAIVFWANFALLILMVGSGFNKYLLLFFLVGLGVKICVDLFFLVPILRFLNKKKLLPYIVIFELFNVIYMPVIAIWGSFAKFEWKNRTYKK